jgi:hypothetical protein
VRLLTGSLRTHSYSVCGACGLDTTTNERDGLWRTGSAGLDSADAVRDEGTRIVALFEPLRPIATLSRSCFPFFALTEGVVL